MSATMAWQHLDSVLQGTDKDKGRFRVGEGGDSIAGAGEKGWDSSQRSTG